MTKCGDPSQSALGADLLLIIILIDHAPCYFIRIRCKVFLSVINYTNGDTPCGISAIFGQVFRLSFRFTKYTLTFSLHLFLGTRKDLLIPDEEILIGNIANMNFENKISGALQVIFSRITEHEIAIFLPKLEVSLSLNE